MSISRDTFDETKNYKRLRYHQDRDLLDSELNEQQDILHDERKKIADRLFKEGSVIHGLGVSAAGNVLTVGEGLVYIDGSIERMPGAVLTYDPAITSGADYVYVELLKYNYGANHDAVLVNPATGEPTAEREKWVLTLKDEDTSEAALPNNVSERKVVAIYKFERESGAVTATVQEKSNLSLEDLLGTLPGKRITVSSITEDQLAFAAAEGLNSLLENLAERTFDQAGSYLVEGLDSFIGGDDGSSVEVVTNAGRAYIQGYRLQKDLPTTTVVPKSVATKPVRGEQKTFGVGTRGGHEQWMSCTNHSSTQTPNCNYYNASGCTQQETDNGNNSHGGAYDSISVSCPVDFDGDGSCDAGGCMGVSSYTLSNNWMSMYELDHGWGDDFVTTLYFPNVSVTLTCDVWGCDDVGSAWASPSSSTVPSTGVDARLALAVINIYFIDSYNTCEELAEYDESYDCY